MATTSSHQRAHLLREMNRTRHSSSSSRHSQSPQPTLSDFDPENEAIMSTRQLDNNAQKLPELRASAQKYSKPRFPEADYLIDTSALGRAFPDFSQGNSSDDNEISIEIGRGAKKNHYGAIGKEQQARDASSDLDLNPEDDSLTFKAPLIDNHQVMYSRPLDHQTLRQHTSVPSQDASDKQRLHRNSGLRNQIQPSPPAKTKDYGSGESRKSSEGSRRTLSAMHARVREENEISQLNEERPPTAELTVPSTRFRGNRQSQNPLENGIPKRFHSSSGFHGFHSEKPAKKGVYNHSRTPQRTQQSFALPEMPNMSELVSGVFEDGTPVFSRSGKSRATQGRNGLKQCTYTDVHEVPVPYDEQAIFLSLKLLQDKVSMLEREKAGIEVTANDLKEKNLRLEAEKTQQRRHTYRNDSAIGTTDSEEADEVAEGRQRGRVIQKNRTFDVDSR